MNVTHNEIDRNVQNLTAFWTAWTNDKDLLKKKTAKERYLDNGAPDYIVKFLELESKTRGKAGEKYARHAFPLIKESDSTDYDHKIDSQGTCLYVEQKTSTRWGEYGDFHFQHIEPNHGWNALLFLCIDYKETKFYMISRADFKKALEEGLVTVQGKKVGETTQSFQGYWTTFKKIKKYLTKIASVEDIKEFINHSL